MVFYIDSDGVAADFNKQLLRMFGVTPHEISDPEMWRLIHSDFRFWSEMPLLPDARRLWDEIKHLNPIVLTGCNKGNYEAIAAEKKRWWKHHFDHDHVITCLSKDKALHLRNPGDILVDDMTKNIKRWEKAGGVGIVHKDADQTLKRLREMKIL